MVRAQITKAKAEECLTAVKTHFAAAIEAGMDPPVLYEPGFHTSAWSIAWDGGPYEWAILAFHGGIDEDTYELAANEGVSPERAREIARVAACPVPAGVFVEPVSSWCLGLYLDA
jgi:hypothetical protein